jgi:hypothetical protein
MKRTLKNRGYIYILSLVILSFVIMIQSGCEEEDPFAGSCPEKSLRITLDFGSAGYPQRNLITSCSTISNSNSELCDKNNFVNEYAGSIYYDPSINTAPGLAPNEFYCAVMVESTCSYYPRFTAWNVQNIDDCFKEIIVPNNAASVVTVTFIETCSSCNNSFACPYSREKFVGTVTLQGNENGPINIDLQYFDSECHNLEFCQ